MQLNTLQAAQGITRARRIGRGGKRGKTSGRGSKGQKARAGHKIRPAERDTIKRIPKRRGYGKNRARTVRSGRVRPALVHLDTLERVVTAGSRVDPAALVALGVVERTGGRVPMVKVLSRGTLTKRVVLVGCTVSATARAAIVAAGGEVA